MKRCIILLFLVLLSCLYGEETITQNKAYSNRNFKVYVRTDVPYSRDLDVEYLTSEEDRLRLTAQPYLRSYDGLSGTEGEFVYEDMTEIVLNLSAEEGGIYYCSGLRLFRENYDRLLPAFPLVVHNRDETKIDYPLELYWSDYKKTAYTGEMIPLILNTRYLESLDFPEKLEMAKPGQGLLEQVDLSGSVDTYMINGVPLYGYPLESWYYTSNEPGQVRISGGKVGILGLERTIPAIDLEVLPLPEEVRASGGVGTFRLSDSLSSLNVAQGEIINYTLRLEGTGNFPYLTLPSVEVEGLDLINISDSQELLPTDAGYQGYIEREYRFQAIGEGKGSIRLSPFVWLDPREDILGREDEREYSIALEKGSSSGKGILTLPSVNEIRMVLFREILNGPLKWFFLIPGLIYFILSLFRMNKKQVTLLTSLLFLLPLFLSFFWDETIMDELEMAQYLYEEGRAGEAHLIYDALFEKTGSPVYLFNSGVVYYKLDDLVQAQLYIRRALFIEPDESLFRDGLALMEKISGLEDQYPLRNPVKSSQLIWFFIIMSNGFLIVLGRHFRKPGLNTLVLMTVAILLILFDLGFTGFLVWTNGRAQGIVDSSGGSLVRIPEETAQDWLTLVPGTAVQVKTEKRGFYFIKTGYGLEGWISRDQLRLLEGKE